MNQDTTRFVKFRSNPKFAITTESGINKNASFNKAHPNVLKSVSQEVIHMLFHHYGVDEAKRIINEQVDAFEKPYSEFEGKKP